MKSLTFTSTLFLLTFELFNMSPVLAQSSIKTTLVSGPGRDRNEGASMVCDGQLNTKWCIDSPRQMPYIIILDAGQPRAIAEYGFATGDDTSTYPDRNPITWRVSGSNDQESWTILDNQKNNRVLPDEDQQEYRFKPTKKGDFRYYRFEFFKMKGGSRIQLSEICLYNTVQTPIKATFVNGTGHKGMKEGAEKVADGYLSSKWCIDEPQLLPYNVVFDAGQPTTINEYRFYTGDDTHTYPSRNPVSWRVSGSNDKQNWNVVDEQNNNRRLRDENEQEYRFKPANNGNYRYYRFEFLKMADGTRLQLSEIRLYK